MAASAEISDRFFEGGPPRWLCQQRGLVGPGRVALAKRAELVAVVAWAPMAVLAVVDAAWLGRTGSLSLFTDFAAYARSLIALPLLVLAEADCLPRFGRIAMYFREAGLVREADADRFDAAVASTRRLLDSRTASIVIAALAYVLVIALIVGVPHAQWAGWQRAGEGAFPHFSLAGWWHVLVALPLLLVLLAGWFWRLLLWTRFLALLALLDLRIIPSHPDGAGGLRFVSGSLRGLRLFAVAVGSVVAGGLANRVVHESAQLLELKESVMLTLTLVLIVGLGPLAIFMRKLRLAKIRGMFEYGACAGFVGEHFERKWLRGRPGITQDSLEVPDFSAVTDLYAVVANVYGMRDVPFDVRNVVGLAIATLVPFLPVVLLAMPMDTIIDRVVQLLL